MPPKKKVDPDEQRPYHIGCDRQGPKQSYILGGQALTYQTQTLQRSGGGTGRVAHFGSIAMLREDEAARIVTEAHRHIVRRGKVIDSQRPGFRRQRGDTPVGCFVYCVPSTDGRAPLVTADAGPLPPRICKDADDWQPPIPEIDPALAEEQERAKIQAQAIAQALSASGMVAVKE